MYISNRFRRGYSTLMNLEWLDETIGELEKPSLYYRFARWFLKRELTYKDIYLITVGLLRRKEGEEKARELALQSVLKLYKNKHNKLPEGVE